MGKGYKYPKIIVDGYEYKIHIKKQDKTRWTCANYKHSKCKSIIYTYGNVVNVLYNHNHDPTLKTLDYKKLIPQSVTILRQDRRKQKQAGQNRIKKKYTGQDRVIN